MRQRTWLVFVLMGLLMLALPVQASLPDEPTPQEPNNAPRSLLGVDVFVEKQGPFETTPGRTIGYRITFGNLGTDATGVEIRDHLPDIGGPYWLTWQWDNGPDQGYTRRHGVGEQRELAWTGNLAGGEVHTIYVTLTVSSNVTACHELSDEVEIIATTAADVNLDNNTDVFLGPRVMLPDLSIAKTVEGLAIPGDILTYTLAYSTSCEVAENVVITDVLPEGMDFLSASPPPDSSVGKQLVWRDAVLAAGRVERIQVVGRVLANTPSGAVLTNTVTITNPLDNNWVNNTAVVTSTVGRADVTVSKNCPEYAQPGRFMEYVLTYANEGVVTARSTRLVDRLPQGVEFRGSSPAPDVQRGRELQWNLGDLEAGDSDVLTMTVFVDASLLDGNILTNTATIMTDTPEDDVFSNTATCGTEVQRTDLWLKQVGCVEAAIPGETIIYRFEFGNQGAIAADHVVLTNCFPEEIDLASVVVTSDPAPTAPFTVTDGCYALALPNLLPGETGWAEFSAQIEEGTGAGTTQVTITDTAESVTETPETNYLNNRAQCRVAVNRSNITLLKGVAPQAAVMPGNQVTFTLVYSNEGAAEATDVALTDTLPLSLTLVSGATTPAPTRSETTAEATDYVWEIGAVAPHTGGEIILVAEVATQTWHAITYTLTNAACISTSAPESDLEDHCASADVQVIPGCTANITIEADPDYLPADGRSTSAITVTVTDVYSNFVMNGTEILMTTDRGLFKQNGRADILKTTSNGRFTVTLIASEDAGPATVTAAFLGNSVCTSFSVTRELDMQEAAIAITKTVSPEGPIGPGDPITYTLHYTNTGPGVAMAAVVTDTLHPQGFVVDGITSDPLVNPTGTYPNYSWSVGDLEPGAGGVITITGHFDFNALWQDEQEVRNCAGISSQTDDSDLSDNATCSYNPLLTADVWVAKRSQQSTAQPSDTLSWTILVGNNGPATARDVVVTDILPAGVSFVASVPTSTIESSGVVFNIGDLAPNATYTIRLFASADCAVESRQQLANHVQVSTVTREHDESNNEAEATTTIIAPKLVTRLEPDIWPVCEGSSFVYKLWYANESDNASARDTVITATFDSALQVTPIDPAWNAVGGNIFVLDLGVVPPGSTETFDFLCVVPVRSGATPFTLTSQATIAATSKAPCLVKVASEPSVLVTRACDFIFLVLRRRMSGF